MVCARACDHHQTLVERNQSVVMGLKNPSPLPADDNSHSPRCASRFPSSVALHQGKKMFNHESPKGSITATTGMLTSPLSSVHYSPVEPKRRSRHSNNYNQHCDKHFNVNESHKEEQQIPRSTNKQSRKINRRRQHSSSTRHETLTWKMDPIVSFSDFTLSIIGIEDKEAIDKHLLGKEKRRKKKRSKSRDDWMVEGFYLDMLDSEGSDGGCESSVDAPSVKSTTTAQYYLHKVNLAVGLRSCEYFSRLFRKKSSSSDGSIVKEHTIELPKSCLQAIPAMLDYLYDPDPTVQVNATTTTAIPLRYLGEHLGNRLLFDSATRFLQMDLSPETAVTYLQQAETYEQKKLAEVCARVCAESFTQSK